MRVVAAFLCDAVTVRDNLLHVLGGGVNVTARTEMPSALGVNGALMMEAGREELGRDHYLTVMVERVEGKVVGQLSAVLALGPPDDSYPPDIVSSVPVALPLASLPLTEYGSYSVRVILDDEVATTMQLLVTQQPAPVPPAGTLQPHSPPPPVGH